MIGRVILFIVSAAQVSAAEVRQCEDLWMVRNLIFDRGGYCFTTPLGEALFDNADCTTSQPAVPAEDAARVVRIREIEAERGCAIDASARGLADDGMLELYRELTDLPVPELYTGGCIDYLGTPFDLRAGAAMNAEVIGRADVRRSLGFAHYPQDGWTYMTVHARDGSVVSHGWAILPDPLLCDEIPD